MANLILYPYHNVKNEQVIKDTIGRYKNFDLLSKCLSYCVKNNIIHLTFVKQHDNNSDNEISIGMDEVKETFDSGECPEDLDFF